MAPLKCQQNLAPLVNTLEKMAELRSALLFALGFHE